MLHELRPHAPRGAKTEATPENCGAEGEAPGEKLANTGAPSQSAPEARVAPRGPPGEYVRPAHHAWADLLRRTFAIDVLACPDCGGRLRLLATLHQREVVEKILEHLACPLKPWRRRGLPVDLPSPAPARIHPP